MLSLHANDKLDIRRCNTGSLNCPVSRGDSHRFSVGIVDVMEITHAREGETDW